MEYEGNVYELEGLELNTHLGPGCVAVLCVALCGINLCAAHICIAHMCGINRG